ncbi:trypsin-like serine protease [Pannus brasiliensis CCIBt3594]|uniref:Trypsin-like serine protease n=1 Tax=Pannus brasiliensis CCIBt3594 TaxID=1427578 RepID=A0AAW9QEL8_9CHRO
MKPSRISKLSAYPLMIAGVLAALANPSTASVIRDGMTYTQYDNYFLSSTGGGYQNVFNNVGKLTWSGYLCSGTAINASWVLTAAHCLDNTSVSPGGYTFTLGSASFTGAAKFVHPNWNSSNLGAGNDIALLKLGSPISTTILSAFPTLWTAAYGSEIGRTSTLVGFGRTGNGLTGATGSAGFKHAIQNSIDAYGNGRDNYNSFFNLSGAILLTDFDNPLNTNNQNNRIGGTALAYEGDAAPGDSGGGLFIGNILTGITSFGWGRYDGTANSSYGDLSGYTRVASFTDWINTTIGANLATNSIASGSTALGTSSPSTLDTSVPEPGASFGLLALGTLGFLSLRSRARG